MFQKPEDGCTAKSGGHTEMGLWLGQRSQELAATPAILPCDQLAHSSGLEYTGGPSLCPFTAWNKGDYPNQRKEPLTSTSIYTRLPC